MASNTTVVSMLERQGTLTERQGVRQNSRDSDGRFSVVVCYNGKILETRCTKIAQNRVRFQHANVKELLTTNNPSHATIAYMVSKDLTTVSARFHLPLNNSKPRARGCENNYYSRLLGFKAGG